MNFAHLKRFIMFQKCFVSFNESSASVPRSPMSPTERYHSLRKASLDISPNPQEVCVFVLVKHTLN